jgi:hypothetical protein
MSKTALVTTNRETLIAEGHKLKNAIEGFSRCTVQSQAMFGLVLSELKTELGFVQGRRSKADDSTENRPEGTWADFVRNEYGYSEDTVRNWMDMGKAIKPRLKKLGSKLDCILGKPVAELTDKEMKSLRDATHKITYGHTQLSLMTDLGLVKKPGNPKFGHRNKDKDDEATKPSATPKKSDEAAEAQDLIMTPIKQLVNNWDDHWQHLPRKDLKLIDELLQDMRAQTSKALGK